MSKAVCNCCFLFYYTILTILAFPMVSDIDFIVILPEIFCARSTTFPSLNREYHYIEDHYTGVLSLPWVPEAILAQIGTFITKQTAKCEIQSRNQQAVPLAPRVFCPIHFTITFAGQTIVDRYTGIPLSLPKIVKPGFHSKLF